MTVLCALAPEPPAPEGPKITELIGDALHGGSDQADSELEFILKRLWELREGEVFVKVGRQERFEITAAGLHETTSFYDLPLEKLVRRDLTQSLQHLVSFLQVELVQLCVVRTMGCLISGLQKLERSDSAQRQRSAKSPHALLSRDLPWDVDGGESNGQCHQRLCPGRPYLGLPARPVQVEAEFVHVYPLRQWREA